MESSWSAVAHQFSVKVVVKPHRAAACLRRDRVVMEN
jgi:hypothetical protein